MTPSSLGVVHVVLLLQLLLLQHVSEFAFGFSSSSSSSSPNNNNNNGDASYTLFDRFRAECPANPQSIRLFDPSLLPPQDDDDDDNTDHKDAVWATVYRTSNNKPSVFVKDELLNVMRLATGAGGMTTDDNNHNNGSHRNAMMTAADTKPPVAVARLRPSTDFPGTWILDHMRCSLKKERTDNSCEGGSEHKEALSVAMDALLLHYLSSSGTDTDTTNANDDKHPKQRQQPKFDGAIRTKATLVGASLLEERGFQPVQSLSKDMATHISSLDASMERYAEKYVNSMTTKNQGARDRAAQILSLLGRMDRDADLQRSKQEQADKDKDKKDDDDDDYDPWASMRQFV